MLCIVGCSLLLVVDCCWFVGWSVVYCWLLFFGCCGGCRGGGGGEVEVVITVLVVIVVVGCFVMDVDVVDGDAQVVVVDVCCSLFAVCSVGLLVCLLISLFGWL